MGGWPNRLLFLLMGGFAVAAVVSWAGGASIDTLWAPAHVFVVWALVREIDPDHDWTALMSAAVAGWWVIAGHPTASALAIGGMMLAARLVLNSTGRRPLLTDLVFVGVYATAISFTRVGWVAGFGLAVGIYVDGRIAEGSNPASVAAAVLTGLGTSVVATAAGAFPTQVLEVQPIAVTVVGFVGLLAIIRPPPQPFSRVDSRMRWRMDPDRLHGARALLALLLFASALLSGGEVETLTPVALGLVLALAAAEVERLRRPG